MTFSTRRSQAAEGKVKEEENLEEIMDEERQAKIAEQK